MAAIRAVLRTLASGPTKSRVPGSEAPTGSKSLASGFGEDSTGRGSFFEHLPSFVDVDEEAGLQRALSRSSDSLLKTHDVYPWIIRPKDKRKVAWDMVIAANIIWTVSLSPYRIGFNVPAEGGMFILDWIVDFFFYIDVILNFRTGYYATQEDVLVLSPRRIANNYLRGWFTLDFVSSFPFDTILPLIFDDLEKDEVRMLRMLRIFRLFRLGKLMRILRTEQVKDFIEQWFSPTARNLISLLLWIFFICHLFSCMWFFVGNAGWSWCEEKEHPDYQWAQFEAAYITPGVTSIASAPSGWDILKNEDCQCPISFLGKDPMNKHPLGEIKCNNDVSWVRAFEVYRMPNLGRYLTALYFVTKTVLAVGYGDLFPTNTSERMFCVFLELAGAVVYGYILSGITRSVDGRGQEMLKLKIVNEWGQYREFDNMLRKRIKQHYQYTLSSTHGYQDYMLVEGLPRHLRSEIIDRVWPHYVQALTLSLFPIPKSPDEELIGYDLVRDLMGSLRPQQIISGDILCKQDDLLEDIYFIVSGTMEGLMDKDGFAKEAVRESMEYTRNWRKNVSNLAESAPFSSSQVSFEELATRSEVHTLVLDSLLVAVYEKCEYFQTRFDPRASNDADRISYFTYLAQSTCELIAIPTDVVSGTYREYHPEHMKASARRCTELVQNLERCIGSGEYPHEEPDLQNEMVKRRATNKIFYHGSDWPISDLVRMGKCENFLLKSMEEMVLQTIDDHRQWYQKHQEEQERKEQAIANGEIQEESDEFDEVEDDGMSPEPSPTNPARPAAANSADLIQSNVMRNVNAKQRAMTNQIMKQQRMKIKRKPTLKALDAAESQKQEERRRNAELLKRWIIPPKHPYKIAWDSFMGIVIVFSVIIVPYRIGFEVTPDPGSAGDVLDWFVDIFFAIDICASFRTAYVDNQGQMISDLAKIRKNYMAGFFWIDLVSTIPFDRIFSVGRGATLIRVVRLIRLAKLLRLVKLTKLLDDLQEIGISQRALNSVMLLSQLTFLAHLLACGFFFLYLSQDLKGQNACRGGAQFCTNRGETDGSQGLRGWFGALDSLIPGAQNEDYITALYWSFTTMTTVGYGDIAPKSTAERIYGILVMFIGGTAFGYIIGSIAASGTDSKEISMKPVYDFCDRQGLSAVIRTKLRKHMTFYMSQKSNYDEQTYLLELPVHLRIEVLLHVHRETLSTLRLFRPRLLYRDWFIAHVVSLMKPMVCVAGDLVYSKGQKDPYHIYNIFTGACEAVNTDTDELVAVYTKGMIFGLEGAIQPDGHPVSKEEDNGYPWSVTAQPLIVPGTDRESVELFVLKQDVIQGLDDNGSVYFHPLKKLVATAWISQKRKPYVEELEKRKRKVCEHLKAEATKKKKVKLPRSYTKFTTIEGVEIEFEDVEDNRSKNSLMKSLVQVGDSGSAGDDYSPALSGTGGGHLASSGSNVAGGSSPEDPARDAGQGGSSSSTTFFANTQENAGDSGGTMWTTAGNEDPAGNSAGPTEVVVVGQQAENNAGQNEGEHAAQLASSSGEELDPEPVLLGQVNHGRTDPDPGGTSTAGNVGSHDRSRQTVQFASTVEVQQNNGDCGMNPSGSSSSSRGPGGSGGGGATE
ncbi:unnamed protein product [Amoebophrya sp. A120]|nr:unnamed protein product [Amoebophrya sp. A120]|eukprot:GSA120T00024569001.1